VSPTTHKAKSHNPKSRAPKPNPWREYRTRFEREAGLVVDPRVRRVSLKASTCVCHPERWATITFDVMRLGARHSFALEWLIDDEGLETHLIVEAAHWFAGEPGGTMRAIT
jgi:hypothetical protein